jgi:hypothetical protein
MIKENIKYTSMVAKPRDTISIIRFLVCHHKNGVKVPTKGFELQLHSVNVSNKPP